MYAMIEIILPEIIYFLEFIGIVIILIGATQAFLFYLGSFFKRRESATSS